MSVKTIHKPSPNQRGIYDCVIYTDKNIIVNATAGSGKTTVLEECAKLIKPGLKNIFLAFNKKIVEELKTRVPSTVRCSTLHSLGYSSLINHYRISFKLSQYKTFMFSEMILKDREKLSAKDKTIFQYTMRQIVDLVRLNLIDDKDENAIRTLCDHHDIEVTKQDIKDVLEIFVYLHYYNSKLNFKQNQIDFVDMIWLPVVNKDIEVDKYDTVFVDEIQDLSLCQQKLVDRLLTPKSRTIVVGDSFQSIYGFIGSDGNSFKKFENRPNSVTLPLSISYRCAKNIVLKAKEVNPEIEPYEFAEEGEVRNGTLNEVTENDFVISRNNRPLIKAFFDLISQGKKATVIGKDIEAGLFKLTSKLKDLSKIEGLIKLEENLLFLKNQLIEQGIKKPENNYKYVNLEEKILIIELIAQGCSYMFEVEKKIEEIFREDVKAIKLMTIHGSKGLEADRVFLIERYEGKNLIPSKYAIQAWQLVQEANLKFISLTRAKKELIIVHLN